jgi:hypothetical protein
MEKISWVDRVNNKVVLHRVKKERNILYTIKKGQVGEEGDVEQLLDDLRKQEDTGSWRKLRIALFGELSLEEAMDLSQDRLLLDLNNVNRATDGFLEIRTTYKIYFQM